MLLDELPEELLLQSLALLDYSSLASLSSTNRFFHYLTQDHTLWRAVYERTFSPSRRTPSTNEWRASCAARIENLRGFLVRGSNNYHAASARTIFTEMGPENGALLVHLLERSDYTMDSLLVQCQGFAVSNARRLLPRLPAPAALTKLVAMLRERLQEDPRSQTFLLRMLLARHTGHIMSVDAVETFLRCSHLVVYKSIDHPLWFFPPRIKRVVSQRDRRSLRSNRTYGQSATSQEIEAEEGEEIGPVINWGVVETISSMIKLYRDHLSDAIPGFSKSRDDYEYEVPMCSSMFDADLSGNWRGLYGYLDFREFDALDATRAFSPDFFDGIQSLKISSEHAFASSDHPLEHNEEDGTPEVLPESPYSDIASDTESRQSELGAKQSEMNIQRQRFIAEGSSIHGEFHVHGSTMQIPNMERGFKVVQFDEMYNAEGLMHWIMDGIHVPSIGIVGRWRDRTEPVGEGVEGPYCLWRDRVQDLRDQERALEAYEKALRLGKTAEKPELRKVRHLRRRQTDMAYIIIEEKPLSE